MQQFSQLINNYSEYIIALVLLLVLVSFVSLIIVIRSLNKTKKKYQALLKGVGNKNLEEIILSNAQRLNFLEEYLKENENKLLTLNESLGTCLKNHSFKRYNAFDGVGGEQSFSFALMDDNGTGLIISSIHGRNDARTYAKTIVAGKTKYNLSDEEKTVLSIALNRKMKN
ncbi:MAG: hypothetical protein VR72_16430 [Clostridiaceae bacterium BRH_c20a]|nr:MAG: hypothetical protein VR72_16430 [Clostridiaceae bacterium BRH_c20a]